MLRGPYSPMTGLALSDSEILEAISKGLVRIEPFRREALNPAGYDLSADQEVEIPPGAFRLVATKERVELGPSHMGILQIRSSFAREGLIASTALIDPGFKGQLTVMIFNASQEPIRIMEGEGFMQMALLRLGRAASRGYSGAYQGSVGVVGSRRSKPKEERRFWSLFRKIRVAYI
ncbi:MAG: dCTP deaminase [Candidatus Bathyarchaeia archaeon]